MHSFTHLDQLIGEVPSAVVIRLRAIDIGRGSEALYRDQLPGLLGNLADRARIASITASSAIEGVVVQDTARADRIISGRVSSLRDRSEQELAGYRDTQDYLFQEDWRPLNVGLLLHLHRLLFTHTASSGGQFKVEDNLVVDRAHDGSTTVRFHPVPAAGTHFAVSELVDRYTAAIVAEAHHPVLLVGLFALDLLVIHPFEDGNGRVTRAMTSALLADIGYTVCRYVSLEQAIADSADEYYDTLLASTKGWHEQQADPWPWLKYFVSILASAYQAFAERTASARSSGSKQDRVRDYILRHAPAIFRMTDIRSALPGVSDPTIRIVLDSLKTAGVIDVQGVGRNATWRRQDG